MPLCRIAISAGLALLLAGTGASALVSAAEAPAASSTPPVPPALTPAQPSSTPLAAARTRFLRLLEDGRNAEAVTAGEEVLALTRAEFGSDNSRAAAPLTNLATARLRAGDLAGASADYRAAVELIEKYQGILAPRLVNPLLGLGETYTRAGQFAEATAAYERALRVNQVNDGIYNLGQLPIRDGLSEGYLGLGDLAKANFHQEAQLRVQGRKVGTDSTSLAPAMYKLGAWYDRSGQPERARFVYQRAARLIEDDKGENAPELVDALIAIGDTYRAQALLPPDPNSSESPLSLLPLSSAMYRRALDVLDRQPAPVPLQRGRTYVALGDLYMLWGRRATAEQAYGRAWATLAGEVPLENARDEYFSAPSRLMGLEPPRLYPRSIANRPPDAAKLLPGFVVVGYAVEPSGKAVDVRVIESDPPGLLDEAVLLSVRNSLFRPRYENGQAVASAQQVYRHEFRYQESRLQPKAAPLPEGGRLEQPGAGATPAAGDDAPAAAPAAPPVPAPPADDGSPPLALPR